MFYVRLNKVNLILGTGSAGACPSEQQSEGDSPSHLKGLSPCPKLAPLPIALPQNWTEYVNTPLTDNDLAKVRMKRAGLA